MIKKKLYKILKNYVRFSSQGENIEVFYSVEEKIDSKSWLDIVKFKS